MNAPLTEAVRRALTEVTLDDKWTLDRGRAYMSGTQALIRLTMLQRQRDQLAGLNTAGFITGYRGSPLGGVDQTAVRAKKHLERHHVRFQPGVNEDLAATACGARSRSTCTKARSTTASLRCGTAKAPASIAAATCSSMRMRRAPASTAACWRWQVTTMEPSRRRCRINRITSSKPA